ncbi:MAG: hypothetical protein QXM12_01320, partial [Nitrososphaerota archaeon]
RTAATFLVPAPLNPSTYRLTAVRHQHHLLKTADAQRPKPRTSHHREDYAFTGIPCSTLQEEVANARVHQRSKIPGRLAALAGAQDRASALLT